MTESPIEAWVRAEIERRMALVEQMCEAALQGGEHGVLVIEGGEYDFEVRVDPSVPYGNIYWRHQMPLGPQVFRSHDD